MSLQSHSELWDLTQFSQSPSAVRSYCPESHPRSETSSFSKVILVLGKAWSHRVQIWAVGGLSHLGDLMFHQKTAHDGTHEQAHSCDEAVNHQLPIAAAFWIIQIGSVEECLSLMPNLIQIHCSTCSVILNVTATQYTCSLNSISHPHWLVQWSCHCSFMHIPVHSPWLPGYIDVMQTILILLTMAGLTPDRSHMSLGYRIPKSFYIFYFNF